MDIHIDDKALRIKIFTAPNVISIVGFIFTRWTSTATARLFKTLRVKIFTPPSVTSIVGSIS